MIPPVSAVDVDNDGSVNSPERVVFKIVGSG